MGVGLFLPSRKLMQPCMNSGVSHLVRSHRSLGTARCEGALRLHSRLPRGPTSTASLQTES